MKAKMLARWGAAAIVGLTSLLGVRTVAASAASLYRDGFGQVRQERFIAGGEAATIAQGAGWRAQPGPDPDGIKPFQGVVIDLEKAGAHLAGGMPRGTVSAWVQRDEATEGETLLSFTDSRYGPLASFVINWNGWGDAKSYVYLNMLVGYPLWYESGFDKENREAFGWTQRFEIPAVIPRGAWFNFAVTWGPTAGERQILFNGQRVKATPANEFALKQVVADAAYLVVGATPHVDPMATAQLPAVEQQPLPNASNIMHSLIAGVEIQDAVVGSLPERFVEIDPVAISAVEHNVSKASGFSGKLVAGNALKVQVFGTVGAAGSFDIAYFPDFDRKIALDWRGWGVYLEDKVFFEPGEVDLRDVEGYQVYASTSPIDTAVPGLEPVERLDVQEQQYTVEGLDPDTPYYVAVMAEMRDGTLRTVYASPAKRPLVETEPGIYTGSWEVTYRDRIPRAVVVGRLAGAGETAVLAGGVTSAFAADPALTIAVATDPPVLKADEQSVAKVSVTVTDANGNPVSGHEVKYLLATTSQYTGVVGGGAFKESVGGTITESSFSKTDLFGKTSATYLAGFAAKTAVIVVRDMASNDTGAGYVKTFIQATASLELEPVANPAMDEGYAIAVTSSDAWLTADGKSQARITARVTLGGAAVEGHRVSFSVAGGGTIRVVSETTGRNGEARAVYTAGKKIGIALITATDLQAGISGSVAIELRSDAPAKIAITIDPGTLPADGRSRADLQVLVTDINDNPNENTEVEYALVQGSGTLRDEKGLTDRRGEVASQYTAGRTPGTVTFEITVRSTEPTAEELLKARNLALAVQDSRFF